MGNVQKVASREYEWEVAIQFERPSTIHKSEASNASYPGLQLTPIKLWLTDRFFGPGAILEMDDSNFQLLVVGEPYQDGAYHVYTTVVANGQSASYIPANLLEEGSQVSRAGSAYPEYSEQADILTYNNGFRMRNQLTIARVEWSMTGSAYANIVALGRQGKDGRTSWLVADSQEFKAIRDFKKRVEYQMVYDQYTNTGDGLSALQGHNNYALYRGSGLLEQISPSNRRYYTRLTADLIEDFLFDLSYNCLGAGQRKFLALTGVGCNHSSLRIAKAA